MKFCHFGQMYDELYTVAYAAADDDLEIVTTAFAGTAPSIALHMFEGVLSTRTCVRQFEAQSVAQCRLRTFLGPPT